MRKDKCNEISRKLLEKIRKDKQFMPKINAQIISSCDKIKAFAYKNLDFINNPKKYSLAHVFKLYKEHNRLTTILYTYSRVPQALDRGTSHFTTYLLNYLKEKDPKNYMSYFHVLTTPEAPTEVLRADFDEDKIIRAIKKANLKLDLEDTDESKWFLLMPPKIYDNIQDFLKKWGHFDYHGYGNRRLMNLQDFIIKIKEDIKNINEKEDIYHIWLKNIRRINTQKKEIVEKLLIDEEHQRLFHIYGEAGIIKIYRRSAQIINFILLDKIIEYISDVLNVEEYIVRFMTPEELTDFIKNKNRSILLKVKGRFLKSVYHYKEKKVSFITNPSEIKEVSKKLEQNVPKKQNILIGITANLGTLKGKARVIYRPSDPFLAGEILVSESTDPDLTPIMKKASAILTEQGGATSHACIIARELNKPCIVGIDGLLASVKTGDLLQISGEEGRVEVIKDTPNLFIKDLVDINEKEIKLFGGKAAGLFFLSHSGFADYLPLTFCGKYNTREMIFSTKNSEKIKKELDKVLNGFDGKVAVRSSGLSEDTKTQSWAGQYLTLLNVPPKTKEVLDAIKKIYLDADKIKSNYLSTKKIKELKVGFLVQEQIDPLYAGVCFTKDPITNDRTSLVIEFVKGLGEGLVSGKKKPVMCKFRKSDLEVLFADKEIDPQILKILKELAKQAVKIEKKGNKFFDIEFAIDKNLKLYLLQARPITT